MQFSDRIPIENGLFHLYGPYGSTTCETPFTSVRRGIYLSPLNDMQFSDRVRIESGPFHLYGLYGSTTRKTPFTLAKSEKYFKFP